MGGKKVDTGNMEPLKAPRKSLANPLDLMARGRLAFLTRVFVKPVSELARRMVFASIADPTGKRTRKVAARDRSAYWNVVDRDLRYLNTGSLPSHTLEDIQTVYRQGGASHLNRFLKRLSPTTEEAACETLGVRRARR